LSAGASCNYSQSGQGSYCLLEIQNAFFCYKGKMFCYLWVHKKNQKPYIGIVEGKHFDEPFLIQEDRSRMKIMVLDPNEDLPLKAIETILQKAINLYKTGVIKLK
jgi:hypothetical protein